MKSKKLGFAVIAIIILLSVPPLAFGKSESYLVPVTIGKTDRTLMEGYIVFSPKEIQRLGSWVSGRGIKKSHRRGPWVTQGGRRAPSKLLEFHRITFKEGGHAVFITYRSKKTPVAAKNFFSRKGIQLTTDASNPDVLPQLLPRGKILWIERTGEPQKVR